MGWNVDVAFGRSAVHGTGVFARDLIPAGTKVWQFDASMQVCTRTSLARLDPETLSFALCAGYLHKPSGAFLWYADGMQFMNHGDGCEANVGLYYWPKLRDDHIVALRDIEPGEELREDYRMCLGTGLAPNHWLRPLYLAFCPAHYGFLLGLICSQALSYARAGTSMAGATKLRTVAISASSSTGFDKTAPNPDARQAA